MADRLANTAMNTKTPVILTGEACGDDSIALSTVEARLGNGLESLVGFVCTLEESVASTRDQVADLTEPLALQPMQGSSVNRTSTPDRALRNGMQLTRSMDCSESPKLQSESASRYRREHLKLRRRKRSNIACCGRRTLRWNASVERSTSSCRFWTGSSSTRAERSMGWLCWSQRAPSWYTRSLRIVSVTNDESTGRVSWLNVTEHPGD
ncbi:hypothetical protein FI667_g10626, partial [Globisporangium splendens]